MPRRDGGTQITKFGDPVKPWFDTLEAMGEYIGIRYGKLDPESGEVDWIYRPHAQFDGIGGFGDILRCQGAQVRKLPELSSSIPQRWLDLPRALPELSKPPKVLAWREEITQSARSGETLREAPAAVAWHLFSKRETDQIVSHCRKMNVTVNSFLLKHLSEALRPGLQEPEEPIPWMIPVNLRGSITQDRDTGNHSSYVAVKIDSQYSIQATHKSIYNKLERGEHWANWKAYGLTKGLPINIKKALIDSNRAMIQWNVGSFSNLGVWDDEYLAIDPSVSTPWLFAPPVLKCQMIGAGCLTFGGRLSLMLQTHPSLTTSDKVVREWVNNWVKQIELDIPTANESAAIS